MWVTIMGGLLAGCASKADVSHFEPLPNGEFQFEAKADSNFNPPQDGKGEWTRMQWFEEYLSENRLCPNGYEIAERNTTLVRESVLGNEYLIRYKGHCTT
jgi:hypothetical protein